MNYRKLSLCGYNEGLEIDSKQHAADYELLLMTGTNEPNSLTTSSSVFSDVDGVEWPEISERNE